MPSSNDSDHGGSSSKLTQVFPFHFEHCLVYTSRGFQHFLPLIPQPVQKLQLIFTFQTSCIVMDVFYLIYKFNGMYHHTLHDRTRIWRNIQDEI